ncbi:hypothetical protein SAMN05444503_10327 [Pseudomonas sp. BS3767]|uniref:Uncharacterized protein n=1 Tax=Pseudomonas syringae TaxID=317 RepID=A0AB37ZIH1_PSESX|nr:hypothetical protein SAMN05444503_10327 [Pseudomonas sp. BS3767]SDM40259.1 hypothetical protein SAMN05444505_102624 [Pseudomonas syringae]SDM79865.1 hypothetical protein SAMN05444502_102751 [Pseudomonas sp. BS3759]
MSHPLPTIRTSRLLLAALQPEQALTLSRLADEPTIAAMTLHCPAPTPLSMRGHSLHRPTTNTPPVRC